MVGFTDKEKDEMVKDGYICDESVLGNVYYLGDSVIATGDIHVDYVTYPWLTCFEVKGLAIRD